MSTFAGFTGSIFSIIILRQIFLSSFEKKKKRVFSNLGFNIQKFHLKTNSQESYEGKSTNLEVYFQNGLFQLDLREQKIFC